MTIVLMTIAENLQSRLVMRFVQVMLHAQHMQQQHQDGLKGRIAVVQSAVGEVNTIQDQDLFVDHNIRPFSAPSDWTFEPCSSHYDTVSCYSSSFHNEFNSS